MSTHSPGSMTLMLNQAEDLLCGKQVVFLVGAPRSGTTWLQLLLSRSPFIATAQETDLFNIFLRPIVTEWDRYRRTGEPASLSEVLAEEEFRTLLRTVSGFVFAKIAQAKPSATVVLEKTPNHVNCWQEILDLWPDAHFIHIIRDPRSVVASLRHAAKSWGPQGWGGSSQVSTISERWRRDVTDGRQIRSATYNYQEVTFEELLSDTSNVLMRILTGLGIRLRLDECQRYVDECSIENLKAAKLTNAPFDLARIGRYRFRIGTTDSWRIELSKWEVALVEYTTRPLMSELGFKPANSSKVLSGLVDLSRAAKDAARSAKQRFQSLAKPR